MNLHRQGIVLALVAVLVVAGSAPVHAGVPTTRDATDTVRSDTMDETGAVRPDPGIAATRTGVESIDPTTRTAPIATQVDGSAISGCTVIDAPGRYTLTSNVTNDAVPEEEVTCIEITADDVVLDGNGYEIEGTVEFVESTSVDEEITGGTAIRAVDATNVTVRNVTVRSWQYGVSFENVTDGVMQVFAYDYAAPHAVDSESIVLEDSVLRGAGTDLEADDVVVRRTDIDMGSAPSFRDGITIDGEEALVANNSINLSPRTRFTPLSEFGLNLSGDDYRIQDNVLIGKRPTREDPYPQEGLGFTISGDNHTIVRNRITNTDIGPRVESSRLDGTNYTVVDNYWPQLVVSSDGSEHLVADSVMAELRLRGSQHTVRNSTLKIEPYYRNFGVLSLQGSDNTVRNVRAEEITTSGENVTVRDSRAGTLSASGQPLSIVGNSVSSLSLRGVHGSENITLAGNQIRDYLGLSQFTDFVVEDRNLAGISVGDSDRITLRNVTANVSLHDTNDSRVSNLVGRRVYFDSSWNNSVSNATVEEWIRLRSSGNNTVSNVTAGTVELYVSPNNTVRDSTAEKIYVTSQSQRGPFSDNNTIVGNDADLIRVLANSRNNTVRDNDAAVRISNMFSYDNVVVGNDASDVPEGIEIDGASRTLVENNTVANTNRGIVLRDATDNRLVNNTVVDNSKWDYFSTGGSTGNAVIDLTVGPTVSFDSRDVALREATDPPQPPDGQDDIGVFLVLDDTNTGAWANLTVQYTDLSTVGVDEGTLRLWRYADGSWEPVGQADRLDTTDNRVGANVSGTDFGIVAPLGDAVDNSPPTIDAISDQTVTEGESAAVPVTASDADGDTLSLSLERAPGFVSLTDTGDGTGTLGIAPETGDSGTYTVEVLTDDGTATTVERFTLTVEEAATTHTVEIIGDGPKSSYEFSVSGEVTEGTYLNPADSFAGQNASGTVGGGADAYTVTGDLTRLAVDGNATVEVDGQVVDPADYDPHTIEVVGDGTRSVYEFSVSEEVLGGEALQSDDEFTDGTASGTVGGGLDRYTFDGDLTRLAVDGNATVEVDGDVVDPADYNPHTIEIVGDGPKSTYAFTVSDEITEGTYLNAADSFAGQDASGTVGGGLDRYTFDGDLTRLAVDGTATVVVDGKVVDPADYDPHTIEVVGDGTRSVYEFTVSDEITEGTYLNAADSFSGKDASGTVGGGMDSYTFDGQLTRLAVDGTATVEVDGRVVDPADYNGGDTPAQQPFGDGPADLAGRIQAEHFDEGGEGVAYHDTDPQWDGRPSSDDLRGDTRVDLKATTDVSGEYTVGRFREGEWLEYTVDATPGTYDLALRVATPRDDRQLRVSLNGETLRTVDIPNTGDWDAYQTVTVEDVSIDADGTSVLRIETVNSGMDLNWFEFQSSGG